MQAPAHCWLIVVCCASWSACGEDLRKLWQQIPSRPAASCGCTPVIPCRAQSNSVSWMKAMSGDKVAGQYLADAAKLPRQNINTNQCDEFLLTLAYPSWDPRLDSCGACWLLLSVSVLVHATPYAQCSHPSEEAQVEMISWQYWNW